MLAFAHYTGSQKAKSWYHTGFPRPVFFSEHGRDFASGFANLVARDLISTRVAFVVNLYFQEPKRDGADFHHPSR